MSNDLNNSCSSYKLKKFFINFSYSINRIFFPPAKLLLVIWSIVWIWYLPADRNTPFKEKAILVLIGYLSLWAVGNLVDCVNKIKHLEYKVKITQKFLDRLAKLLNDNEPESSKTQYGTLSIGKIQRKYGIGFNKANEIMNALVSGNFVGQENEYKQRNLLCDENTLWNYIESTYLDYINLSANNNESTEHINVIDSMEGHDFEYFCADVLRKNGFVNVEVTQGSGDHGIDIVAEKDDISYAIQCKCYSSNIGNSAVQQAHTGKSLYKKDVAVVMTNQFFTQQAKDEAAQLGVKLWDRDKLNELISKANTTS